MLDFKTVYGARIRKDTRLYYLADSSELDEMMCCIFKGKMYTFYYKEVLDSNQKLYEAFVEALALLNIYKMRFEYKKMIKTNMRREDILEIRDIVENLSDDFINDFVVN